MRHTLQFLLLIGIVFFISCSKNDFSDERNIASWTEHVPTQNRDLYQIRLAFGKTLAAALKEKELRAFIKQKSIITGEKVYQELVYALIKDEKLPSGKTVAQVIQANEDAEVKELYGETLLDRVAIDDPMLAIKLPDVFYQYDWDTEGVTPFVGVETPSRIKVGQWETHYSFYYYNGYQELIKDFESKYYDNIKYFYLMIKYASDHILINVNNMTNEKNITLEEFMPQIKLCKANILPDILKSGIRDSKTPNKIYLNLRTCFDIWYEQCSYKGPFLYDQEPCLREKTFCPRDCISDNLLLNNAVLTGFDIRKDIVLFQLSGLFDESFIHSYHYFKKNGNTFDICRIAIPERNINLFQNNLDVKVNLSPFSISGVSFTVPLVDLTYTNITQSTNRWKSINLLLTDDLKKEERVVICGMLLAYKDIVNEGTIYSREPCGYFVQNSPPMSAQYILSSDGIEYGYCTKGDIFAWNYGIGIKY
jgi:hypothetical protein